MIINDGSVQEKVNQEKVIRQLIMITMTRELIILNYLLN